MSEKSVPDNEPAALGVPSAEEATEERSNRVADLRRRVQQGEYQVAAADVAARLIDEHLIDEHLIDKHLAEL